MSIFFTADHHFGHANIIGYHKRPFTSAHEMNEELILRWNETVKPRDTVYHLGDLSLLSPDKTIEILNRLNGKIYLIRGNHEKSAESDICASRFEWIKDYHFLALNHGIKMALMHYALRVWDQRGRGSWNLYGHSHGKLLPEDRSFALDVGVDCWEFKPVPLFVLRDKMIERGWSAMTPRPSKT